MKEKEGKQIYLFQHKFNPGWTYIGATKQKLYAVKSVKFNDARRGRQKGPLYQAMQQDDNSKHWVITLLHDFTENWEQLETAFIRLFSSYERGLNGTADGRCGWREAIRATSKPVTNNAACYASANEASRMTGINQSNITACCLGKRKTAGGFAWQYVA